METLDGSSWDVVISGTGLQQSLLALALSRSGKRILHIDRNEYYGGDEAALSLAEALDWSVEHRDGPTGASTTFSHASVGQPSTSEGLQASRRAYSLALAPHILYCCSELLCAVVASQIHRQLDFQAVSSWFIVTEPPNGSASQPRLTRVPGGREDIFRDASLDLKAKRCVVKFLRFAIDHEQQLDTWHASRTLPLTSFLEQKFALPPAHHPPILALALSSEPSCNTTVEYALPRIARHLRSIGVFGPGFAAVLPKWGGLAEIGQVACRAGAVGGAVYVLGKGLSHVQTAESGMQIELTGGERITTHWLAGTAPDLCAEAIREQTTSVPVPIMTRSISIISSSLPSLFPPTCEGGVSPVGAVVLIPSSDSTEPPVHVLAHSGDSGECPADQCVLYGYVAQDSEFGIPRLKRAVALLCDSVGDSRDARVLWHMHWEQRSPPPASGWDEHVITMPPVAAGPAFDDGVLIGVKDAWERIMQPCDPEAFMKFDARDGTMDDGDA